MRAAGRVGEHEIVGLCCLADGADAFEIFGNVAGGNEIAEFVLSAHMQDDEFAALFVGPDRNIAPVADSWLPAGACPCCT